MASFYEGGAAYRLAQKWDLVRGRGLKNKRRKVKEKARREKLLDAECKRLAAELRDNAEWND